MNLGLTQHPRRRCWNKCPESRNSHMEDEENRPRFKLLLCFILGWLNRMPNSPIAAIVGNPEEN